MSGRASAASATLESMPLTPGRGHARTLREGGRGKLARAIDGARIQDPERTDVVWSYSLLDGQLAVEQAEAEKTRRSLIDYALGSGQHATSFVTLLNSDPHQPKALEHRLTHYTAQDVFAVTPGQ